MRVRVGSWLTWRMAPTGLASEQVDAAASRPRSSPARCAVVPTFRNVATSRQVGVADDHVEAAVLLGVAVGLVAGVDDRALQRGLEPDLLLEEVGPLGELERHVGARDARAPRCRPCRRRVKIWRVTKCGMIWLTMRPNGTARASR